MLKQRYKHFSEQRFINRDPRIHSSNCEHLYVWLCPFLTSIFTVVGLRRQRRPLRSSQIIRFTYTNSFMYPITFNSARFC
ncbi:hypothetical protein CKAN_01335100 [Cinnamomum micranthum f. kanehirae]|uniref:Uncharacterized protein n=1 Tax=Cinnamomum micranthum f. kanehirae TaxID=337451 RepID=A0A3S3NQK5_9MAGN|nr:hypothetical protein CKAN_01335100 [Cinnamomum micranthum f. kanehirae]